MLSFDNIVVEECEQEVENERSPDGDVVPDCPVGGVQGYLGGDHDDQDGRHHGAKEIVVRQHQSVVICLVMVGSW